MAQKVGDYYGELDLRNKKFIAKTKASGMNMEKLAKMGKIAFAAISAAALAATAAIIKITGETIRYANEVRKAAIATGIGVEQFQALRYAAIQEHSDINALSKGLMNLTTRIKYAGDGLETYLRYFEALGIEYKNQDGTLRKTIDVFMDISDKAHEGALSTDELASITMLFGARLGADLIPLLKKGSGWFKTIGQEARDFGLIMSTEDVEAVKAFDDKMTLLKETTNALKRTFAIELIPVLDNLVKNILDPESIDEFRGAIIRMAKDAIAAFKFMTKAASEFFKLGRGWGIVAILDQIERFKHEIGLLYEKVEEGKMTPQEAGKEIAYFKNQIKFLEAEIKSVTGEVGIFDLILKNLEKSIKDATNALEGAKKSTEDFSDAIQYGINRMGEFGGSSHQVFEDLSRYAGMGRKNLLDVGDMFKYTEYMAMQMGEAAGEAFALMIKGSKDASDALASLLKGLVELAIQYALLAAGVPGPAASAVSGFIGEILPFQKGGLVSGLPIINMQPNVVIANEPGAPPEVIAPIDKLKDLINVNIYTADPNTTWDIMIDSIDSTRLDRLNVKLREPQRKESYR